MGKETNPAARASCRTHPGRSASGSSAEASLTGSEPESCTKVVKPQEQHLREVVSTRKPSQNEGKLKIEVSSIFRAVKLFHQISKKTKYNKTNTCQGCRPQCGGSCSSKLAHPWQWQDLQRTLQPADFNIRDFSLFQVVWPLRLQPRQHGRFFSKGIKLHKVKLISP